MDLDRVAGLHLRYFLCVVDQGSVAAAARVLTVAQPSLSQQISQLERRLGVRLFERSAHGLRKTREGERLEVAARRWIRSLQSLAPAEVATMVVGIPRGAGSGTLQWARTYLERDVRFQTCTSAAAPAMLHEHRLDGAIVRECSAINAACFTRVALPPQPLGLLTSSSTAQRLGLDMGLPVRLDSLRDCWLLWFDESRAPEYAHSLLDQVREGGWEPNTYVFDPASDSLTIDALRSTPGLVALRPEPVNQPQGLDWAPVTANLVETFYLLTRRQN